ncbi:GntR family transcriptional regulator [Lacticaseibacillus parakribbianus]|uniref:GntR family transcriptional regulator n=1 Tax=Lacticaseibacillus parakribbianus TaxID=2970927 RepID=UPI0021CAF315|nr:GntR family transcriptional regulator [Lacticaseibacillus parakribbianus]
MELTVDFDSNIPIYTQIRNAVIGGIAAGQLAPGDPLPSIRALSAALGINLHTVNKAYRQLEDEGFVAMRRGLGAVVADTLPAADDQFRRAALPQLTALIQEARVRRVTRGQLAALIDDLYGKEAQ